MNDTNRKIQDDVLTIINLSKGWYPNDTVEQKLMNIFNESILLDILTQHQLRAFINADACSPAEVTCPECFLSLLSLLADCITYGHDSCNDEDKQEYALLSCKSCLKKLARPCFKHLNKTSGLYLVIIFHFHLILF